MPPIRIYCASQPSARMPRARIPRAKIPRAKIQLCQDTLRRPAPHSPRPAPHQQASDPAQPAKQELPNRPNLAEPFLNQQLASQGSPKTRSANLGFEIRGFFHPRDHESSAPPSAPGLPPSPNPQPKPPESNYQTDPTSPNPIRISTLPSILPPATTCPPKNPTQPNPPNRCAKQTQFHSFTRFPAQQINNTTPSPPPGTVTHLRVPTQSTTASRPSRRK